MAVTATRTDAKKLRGVLDPDWQKLAPEARQGLDDACYEVLQAALELLEEKAKFVTVGKVFYTKEDGRVGEDSPHSRSVCAGFYSTWKQADAAAAELFGKPSTPVHCRVGVFPIHKGTPAAWRKELLEAWAREAAERGDLDVQHRQAALLEWEWSGAEEWSRTPACHEWTPDGACLRPEGHAGHHMCPLNIEPSKERSE